MGDSKQIIKKGTNREKKTNSCSCLGIEFQPDDGGAGVGSQACGQRKLGIIRATVELLIAMVLVFLASDVLYLYYMGAWRGENKIIEVSEVVLLYACIVLGLGYFIWRVRHIRKRGF